jgi:hypothetical protein
MQIRIANIEKTIQFTANLHQEPADLQRRDDKLRLETELCETLTGLQNSIPDYHCLLPVYHAVWQSRKGEELPEWQEWRHWVSHHLGHLELHGMFLSYGSKEMLSDALGMPEIRSVGLFAANSPFYQDSMRMRELSSRLSKMTIFCDLPGTSTLYIS